MENGKSNVIVSISAQDIYLYIIFKNIKHKTQACSCLFIM